MIVALDVHYDEQRQRGTGAGVVFECWQDAARCAEYTVQCSGIEPYQPGEFFRRELPCLLSILEAIKEPVTQIVLDGYVSLDERPGLGLRLWDALDTRVPIIGVAKSRYRGAVAVEVTRGASKAPLYVTAVGVDPTTAAAKIKAMHGAFRIPALLKRVDQLSKAGAVGRNVRP
jgi:deoxyribonuclease V